ncbi:MAG: hypothetical protein IT379_29525 [Deltaproteobacteria bacterium]|nr:hypothetical protein [Deltaproteobacteria bacterium]
MLLPCTGCARHVAEEADVCPFCDTRSPTLGVERPAPRLVPRSFATRAVVFLGASILAGSDCGSGGEVTLYGAPAPTDQRPQEDDPGGAQIYGAPPAPPSTPPSAPPPSAAPAPPPPTTPRDPGTGAGAYGAPPPAGL